MKKIFTSLLMLLVSASSFATDEITSGTNYYIQNKESGLFLCGANSWGTQASVANEGELFTLTGSDGKFTIYDTALSSSKKCLGNDMYTDNNNGTVSFTFAAVDGEGGGIYNRFFRWNIFGSINHYRSLFWLHSRTRF